MTTLASRTQVFTPLGKIAAVGTREPLQPGNSLDSYERFNVATHIGVEFKDAQLSEIVKDDAKIKDLAILISQRNVAFFRNQDLNIEDQKTLAQKLGTLSGKPKESGLHIHPLTSPDNVLGAEVTLIANEIKGKPITELYKSFDQFKSSFASQQIHSDITFEKWPSDYAILKLVNPSEDGGDTIWISGYEVYDRLTPSFQAFLETLTATHSANKTFHPAAKALGHEVPDKLARGNPGNVGSDLSAVHPVVRTNPVTGWKSVYVSHGFTQYINGVSKEESDLILGHLYKLQSQNHDIQARIKWGKNDIAIWDNRSSFHAATPDAVGYRKGDRVVSIGEQPYLDPGSKSRREALGLKPYHRVRSQEEGFSE